jgi:hypothetical protein
MVTVSVPAALPKLSYTALPAAAIVSALMSATVSGGSW